MNTHILYGSGHSLRTCTKIITLYITIIVIYFIRGRGDCYKTWSVSLSKAAVGADLNGNSKYSNENLI